MPTSASGSGRRAVRAATIFRSRHLIIVEPARWTSGSPPPAPTRSHRPRRGRTRISTARCGSIEEAGAHPVVTLNPCTAVVMLEPSCLSCASPDRSVNPGWRPDLHPGLIERIRRVRELLDAVNPTCRLGRGGIKIGTPVGGRGRRRYARHRPRRLRAGDRLASAMRALRQRSNYP